MPNVYVAIKDVGMSIWKLYPKQLLKGDAQNKLENDMRYVGLSARRGWKLGPEG